MEHQKIHTLQQDHMGNRVKLSQLQIDILSRLPEQGMGYQIVDLTLKNGKVIRGRIVLNSTYLKIKESESFCADDIERIELHKK